MLSLKDLNIKAASETPYIFELLIEGAPVATLIDGKEGTIKLSVIGQQSETFERRVDEINKRFELAKGLADPTATSYDEAEASADRVKQLVAARLVGWSGIEEECTPENALKLISTNLAAFTQVWENSNKVGNFIKR